MRTYTSSKVHEEMIRYLIEMYRWLGYTSIKADHILSLSNRPLMIGKHIPDISAMRNFKTIIAEAETQDSLELKETIEQWKDFSIHASRFCREFHVIVPKILLPKAQTIAWTRGIKIHLFWPYEG